MNSEPKSPSVELLKWQRPLWNRKISVLRTADNLPLFELNAQTRREWTLTSRVHDEMTVPSITSAKEGTDLAQDMWDRYRVTVAALGQSACACGAKAHWVFVTRRRFNAVTLYCCPNHVNEMLKEFDGYHVKIGIIKS